MKFTETSLKGAYIIELEYLEDNRGFFARTFDAKKFQNLSLNSRILHCNISYNKSFGTLRGLHYQIKPYEEAKLIRCTRGKIYDLILDLRLDSETYKQWKSFVLSAENRKMLYVPEGFAHGFQTLMDDTEVFYQMSEVYHPASARGVRWNDPEFCFYWPIANPIISERDSSFVDFNELIDIEEK